MTHMKLYSYFRSSAAFRVRIALNLKGLPYDVIPVHLVRDGGEQHMPAFAAVNPLELVPVLQTNGGELLSQSLAIIEYLEEVYPASPLLPRAALARAHVRAMALSVACEIHPLNNLRVLSYMRTQLQVNDGASQAWYRHWVAAGFSALERNLAAHSALGRYCHGDSPGLADCCLVPQVFNALRFACPMDDYPTIERVYAACMDLPAFQRAAPAAQPDAE
jgi:maleylacetoacetate isomerase